MTERTDRDQGRALGLGTKLADDTRQTATLKS